MKIIELIQHPDGERFYINTNRIVYFTSFVNREFTWVNLGNEEGEIKVHETPEQITELIKNAPQI
jgi:hypothetical protein